MTQTSERSLQSTFLQRFFVDVLGDLDQGAGEVSWTLEAEPITDIDARFPDGRLGFFGPGQPRSPTWMRLPVTTLAVSIGVRQPAQGRAD